jgi:hypothetical protein
MENNQLDILQGGHVVGKFFKSGKAITAGDYKIAVLQEDAVVTAFTDEDNVDQIPLWDIAGETLKAGTILFAHNSKGIKTLTVTSGSGFVLGNMK